MKKETKDILARIERAKKQQAHLTHITDKSKLSAEDKVKIGLCRQFVRFANHNRVPMKQISDLTGIAASRLSEITNYKISKFKVDQLLIYLSKLAEHEPKIGAFLELFTEAAEFPAGKINTTRGMISQLRKTAQQETRHP